MLVILAIKTASSFLLEMTSFFWSLSMVALVDCFINALKWSSNTLILTYEISFILNRL